MIKHKGGLRYETCLMQRSYPCWTKCVNDVKRWRVTPYINERARRDRVPKK